MKSVFRSTFIYYIIAAAILGTLHELIFNPKNKSLLLLLGINILMIIVAFIFSYLGYLSEKKKNKSL
jgi:uncharacterized membrane protein YraQ (UPF0718 family)